VWFAAGVLATVAVSHWWAPARTPDAAAVREVLLENPQLLAEQPQLLARVQAILRSRQRDAEAASRRRLIAQRWARLTQPAFAPTLGDVRARPVLIEFTDYGCEPCRASAAAVEGVLATRPQVRVAVLLLPTSGAVSEFAARVAYAAWRQNPGRFAQFHRLMLGQREELTSERVLHNAAAAGLDVEQIQEQSSVAEVREHLAQVRQFAQDINVVGVPTFVHDGRVLSGGVSTTELEAFVQSPPGVTVASGKPEALRPGFALLDHTGRPTTVADFRGRWFIAYFGFTSCPDVCPTSLLLLAQALRAMGPQAGLITPVLISVDPRHDTPETLARYVKNFGPGFLGLTGTSAQVASAVASFGAYYEPPEEAGGSPVHSAMFYLVDPRGNLDRQLSGELSAKQIAHYLQKSLAQDNGSS
jgi:protein SCO1/2